MFFVFGGRSRGDMHMGYKLSPMALAGLVRNALGLCDLFFFVWWHRTGEAKIWSSSWSWRTFSVFWWQDLRLDLDLCTSVCVSSRTETEMVCVFLVLLKAGGQSKFPHVQTFEAVCGREPQQQAQLYI